MNRCKARHKCHSLGLSRRIYKIGTQNGFINYDNETVWITTTERQHGTAGNTHLTCTVVVISANLHDAD